jgi:hypothetical protein
LAGVDIQKPRLRAVAKALIALAPQPTGFTAEPLAARVRSQQGRPQAKYNTPKAAYDLRKFRGKNLVRRIAHSRRYRVQRPGIRTLAALFILREEVLKPVLAAVAMSALLSSGRLHCTIQRCRENWLDREVAGAK